MSKITLLLGWLYWLFLDFFGGVPFNSLALQVQAWHIFKRRKLLKNCIKIGKQQFKNGFKLCLPSHYYSRVKRQLKQVQALLDLHIQV